MKPYDENLIKKTLIAKLPIVDAKKTLIDLLMSLPKDHNINWPEGNTMMQAESLIEFIMAHFRNISVLEIGQAIELNAAHKFKNYIESYGKLSREFIGGILHEYKQYKINQTPMGTQYIKEAKDIEKDLVNDINSLKLYGSQYNINIDIDEKWDWLTANRPDFDSSIDHMKVAQYSEEEINPDSIIEKHLLDPEVFGLIRYKSKKIKIFLLQLKKVK